MAGIIVGYLPIFFIDEIWSLVARSFVPLAIIAVGVGLVTLLYLYVEVQRRLVDTHGRLRARDADLPARAACSRRASGWC